MNFWEWISGLFNPKPAPVKPPPAPTPPPAPLPSGIRLHCFDVSHYEPNVDWKQAVAAGFRVCMSKFSDGAASVDPTGAADRSSSKANGLVYMPFHFFRFAADPTVQAEHFVKTTGGVQVGELPHCLDLEWDNTPDAPKQYNDGGEIDEAGAQLALTFLEKLETLTGVIPVVYTASGFFPGSASPATVEKFARYLLWVAHYNVNAPRIPKPWLNYAFWQYTSSGEVPGTGKVDCSWYNGSEADLKALLKT